MDRLGAHLRNESPYLKELGQITRQDDGSQVFKPEGMWPRTTSKGHWVELIQVRVVLLVPCFFAAALVSLEVD